MSPTCRRGRSCGSAGGGGRYAVSACTTVSGGDGAGSGGARGDADRCPPFHWAPEGTEAWLRGAALAFGVSEPIFEAAVAPARTRAERTLLKFRNELAGKRIFFFPDSQLEIPLARFVARELGMEVIEAGTPYLHRQHLAEELAMLPAGTRLSEGQDVERQLDRCRAEHPDLVVCGLGLANPLEAEGISTKWSIELLFTPIQGFHQAADLSELFARPLVRRLKLAV